MSRKTSRPTWPLRPFSPNCKETVPVDQAVIVVVRRVLVGWDGNWEAVRGVLRNKGLAEDTIREMTVSEIQQYVATGWPLIVQLLGGPVNTHTGEIVDVSAVGRKSDPRIAERNRKVVVAHKQGLSYDAIRDKFADYIPDKTLSVDNVRRIISDARKRGEL